MTGVVRNRLLTLLHRYNGWNALFLLVSGLILYLPGLRALTAPVRVPLKYLHIGSGLFMMLLLAGYFALAQGHWERLGRRLGQKVNAVLLVTVTAGWSVTGVVLWLHRSFPPQWASAALVWHDWLTWLLLPWLAIHSYTRYFKVKLPVPAWLTGNPYQPTPDEERRSFVTQSIAAVGAGLWALYGWRALQPPSAQERTLPAMDTAVYFDQTHTPITIPNGKEPPGWPKPVEPTTGLFPADPAPNTAGQPPIPAPLQSPPVGGGRKGSFRVYTVTDTLPAFQPNRWRFFAQGLVDRPLNLSWNDFLHLPRQAQVSDFHCVTGWSVYNITWEGVRLRDLLDLLGMKPQADHVKFYSHDGLYTDDLPLDVARQNDVMLAYLIDGQLLPSQYGGPMRLIIPKMYAYKSVKWLGGLELIKGPHIGYWEERGYPRNAWVKS